MTTFAGPAVMGVDTSTQSTTVEIRALDDGRVVGCGRSPHASTTPPISEQDPESWWAAFELAAEQALATVDAQQVRSISVDAQCHGLVALDGDDRPVRPAKLWNDTTAAGQAADLVARFGAEAFARLAGTVPTSAFTISKLAWLADNEPTNLGRVRKVMVPHDYVTYRLAGRAVTDRSDASGTGYYSAVEGRWLGEVLALVDDRDWTSMLPEVLGPQEAAGSVRPEVAARLGLGDHVLVGPGAGDQHASALGLGVDLGDVTVGLGTSGVVFVASDRPVADPTGWISGVADAAGGYLPLVCTLNATKVTDAMARWLDVDLAGLSALAMAAPAGDTGLSFATYLDGERSPNRPAARGLLHGLASDTSREALAKSAFEGVLAGLLAGLQRIEDTGIRTDGRLLVTGGGARALAYRQLLADLSGREVIHPDVAESSARGACVQAAALLGDIPIREVVTAWAPVQASFTTPRPGTDPAALLERTRALSAWSELDG